MAPPPSQTRSGERPRTLLASQRRSRRADWIAAAACANLGLLLFAWHASGRLLVPSEGRQAVLAATSVLAGRGLELRPGTPFVSHGPLLPVLLAGLQAAGLGVGEAVYLINCTAFAATAFALYLLCRRMEIGIAWAAGATAFFALTAPAHYLLRAARPDAIPIACTLFAIAVWIGHAREPSRRALVGMALCCAVATSARYMALFTTLPVIGLALLASPGSPRSRRFADGLRFAVLAGGPAALWLTRNLWLVGNPFGMSRTAVRRNELDLGPGENAWALLRTAAIDLFSPEALGVRRVLYGEIPLEHPGLLALTLFAFVLAVAALAIPARSALGTRLRSEWSARSPAGLGLSLLLLWEIEYSLTLVVLWTVGNNDPIHTRYAAPLYPPAVAIGCALMALTWQARPTRTAAATLALASLLLAVPNALRSARLLGDEPGPRLLEVTGRTGKVFWHQRVGWRE